MYSITDLKKNPMFNLSLSSKELFHSNFLAWIAEDEDTEGLFVEILVLFGLDKNAAEVYAAGIRKGRYIVKREYNNFDFCICENIKNWEKDFKQGLEDKIPGRVLLVLENKFKSIPYIDQLKEYQDKVDGLDGLNKQATANEAKLLCLKDEPGKKPNGNSKIYKQNVQKVSDTYRDLKCHFVLLTLAENVCGVDIKQNELGRFVEVANINQTSTLCSTKWTYITYKEYSKTISQCSINNKKGDYIKDYASFVKKICKYLDDKLPVNNDIGKRTWIDILSSKKDLGAIRMDDIWQKLVANIIASHYYSQHKEIVEFGYDCETILNDDDDGKLHVDTGFSRGSAAFEVRVRIDENCLFGIQIQNGCYRRLLQTTQDKHKQNKDLFKDKISKIFDNNESWRDSKIWEKDLYPTKKSGKRNSTIPEGFCSYGDDFIYKYKKLTDKCTVEEVLIVIDEDIKYVKSLFRN